jgi:hypothetical protein
VNGIDDTHGSRQKRPGMTISGAGPKRRMSIEAREAPDASPDDDVVFVAETTRAERDEEGYRGAICIE